MSAAYPVVDLPALAAEFMALADVVTPMTTERLHLARVSIASAVRRLTGLERVFAAIESTLDVGEPGSDFDFAVKDLLAVSADLSTAQGQVSSTAALLVRTNISLTAAATIAACASATEVH
jgi:hypothetical protein